MPPAAPVEPKHRPIALWKAGDQVSGFAYLRRKETRQDRTGKTYLDLELVDASGAIAGKAWSDSAALASTFEAPGFVKFRGQVQSYRDQLQLKVDNCRVATEADRPDGFDEALLIPSAKEELGAIWRRLEETLAGNLHRPEMRRLAEETLHVYGDRLRTHPAAKSIHHAYRGGLLEHVTSMLGLAVKLADHYPELDRDLLLLGVLFHDLGKLDELGAMPANDYTPVGRLVGHIVLGRDLVRERIAAIPDFPPDLALQLEHLVLSHQGRNEYGSPVVPMTGEAFALHMIDDLDSKLAVLRDLTDGAAGFVWARSLERFVWAGKEAVGGVEEGEDGADDDEAGETPQSTIW